MEKGNKKNSSVDAGETEKKEHAAVDSKQCGVLTVGGMGVMAVGHSGKRDDGQTHLLSSR